jgi:nitrogen fixation NifU-like protein
MHPPTAAGVQFAQPDPMQDLYREHILDHYENPRCTGEIDGADCTCERNSPLCGDRIRVYVKLNADGRTIADARFTGDGCIISQAAASMLLEEIPGRPVEEIEQMPPQHVLDLMGAPLTAQRVKCALLGLQTLKDALREWRAAHPA